MWEKIEFPTIFVSWHFLKFRQITELRGVEVMYGLWQTNFDTAHFDLE